MATLTMDFGAPRMTRARQVRPAAAPVRLTARGRLVVRTAVIALAAVAAYVAISFGQSAMVAALQQAPVQVVADHSVVVKPGDTLWTIATREFPGSDPREAIGRIRTLNGLTSADTLIAGQELAVPAA